MGPTFLTQISSNLATATCPPSLPPESIPFDLDFASSPAVSCSSSVNDTFTLEYRYCLDRTPPHQLNPASIMDKLINAGKEFLEERVQGTSTSALP